MIWSNIMQILKSNSKARFEIYYYANFNIIESGKICLYIVKDIYVYLNMIVRRFKTSHFLEEYIKLREGRKILFQNATHDAHKNDAVILGMHIIANFINTSGLILFLFFKAWFDLMACHSSIKSKNNGCLCSFVVIDKICCKILQG